MKIKFLLYFFLYIFALGLFINAIREPRYSVLKECPFVCSNSINQEQCQDRCRVEWQEKK